MDSIKGVSHIERIQTHHCKHTTHRALCPQTRSFSWDWFVSIYDTKFCHDSVLPHTSVTSAWLWCFITSHSTVSNFCLVLRRKPSNSKTLYMYIILLNRHSKFMLSVQLHGQWLCIILLTHSSSSSSKTVSQTFTIERAPVVLAETSSRRTRELCYWGQTSRCNETATFSALECSLSLSVSLSLSLSFFLFLLLSLSGSCVFVDPFGFCLLCIQVQQPSCLTGLRWHPGHQKKVVTSSEMHLHRFKTFCPRRRSGWGASKQRRHLLHIELTAWTKTHALNRTTWMQT